MTNIYPRIDEDRMELENKGSDYRLKKIDEMNRELKVEFEHQRRVLKKYKKARNVSSNATLVLGVVSASMTTGGVAATLTGPGAVVGIPLAVVGGAFTVISTLLTAANKKIDRKISKHEMKMSIAKMESLSLDEKTSVALANGEIDSLEFKAIIARQREYDKYKSELKKKKAVEVDLAKMEAIIEQRVADETKKNLAMLQSNPSLFNAISSTSLIKDA